MESGRAGPLLPAAWAPTHTRDCTPDRHVAESSRALSPHFRGPFIFSSQSRASMPQAEFVPKGESRMSWEHRRPPAGESPARHRLLFLTLFIIAGGLLLQASLAGLFFSPAAREARIAHLLVGALLPWLGIITAVTAWNLSRQALVTRSHARLATLLLVLLWVQLALGHLPSRWKAAVHVPLGVLLFCLSLHLGLRARGTGA